VSVADEEHAVTFTVRDQGIGISAEDVPRLFRSFEQVHQGNTRRFGGTGLGLSISRSLVEMHHGEIWVESELGAGSTFHFRIPKLSASSEPNSEGVLSTTALPPAEVANDASRGATVHDLSEASRSRGASA
jgi:signal transduction histidine kinase